MRIRLIPVLAMLALISGCELTDPSQPSNPAEEEFAAFLNVDIPNMVKVYDDLYYKDINVGNGTPTATATSTVAITYSGYLKDGTLFGTNVNMDALEVALNDPQLIAGWSLGIRGMKPGGIRKLVIGSSLAYGAAGNSSPGSPTIPPHATLVFNIHLKEVR
jgi:FKBP-type peptidyl-prolyl cis-trans isomerase